MSNKNIQRTHCKFYLMRFMYLSNH